MGLWLRGKLGRSWVSAWVWGMGAWVGGSDVLGGGLNSLPRKPNLSNFHRALNQCLGEELPPPPFCTCFDHFHIILRQKGLKPLKREILTRQRSA